MLATCADALSRALFHPDVQAVAETAKVGGEGMSAVDMVLAGIVVLGCLGLLYYLVWASKMMCAEFIRAAERKEAERQDWERYRKSADREDKVEARIDAVFGRNRNPLGTLRQAEDRIAFDRLERALKRRAYPRKRVRAGHGR